MSVLSRCDRCRAEHELELEPGPGGHFMSVGNVLPENWERILGVMLCERCVAPLRKFLRGADRDQINLNDRVWVIRDGKAHPYQMWDLMRCYGPQLSIITAPPVFESNTIYLTEPNP